MNKEMEVNQLRTENKKLQFSLNASNKDIQELSSTLQLLLPLE